MEILRCYHGFVERLDQAISSQQGSIEFAERRLQRRFHARTVELELREEGLALDEGFRLRLGRHELVPIMIGGMGVDISTAELALEAARLGGVGHISDAMVNDVSDRRFDTTFVKDKTRLYKANINSLDKSMVKFDLATVAEATRRHIEIGRASCRERG